MKKFWEIDTLAMLVFGSTPYNKLVLSYNHLVIGYNHLVQDVTKWLMLGCSTGCPQNKYSHVWEAITQAKMALQSKLMWVLKSTLNSLSDGHF